MMEISRGQALEYVLLGLLAGLLAQEAKHKTMTLAHGFTIAFTLVAFAAHQWRLELIGAYFSLALCAISSRFNVERSSQLRKWATRALVATIVVVILFPLPDFTQLHGEYKTIGGQSGWFGGVECRVFYPSSKAPPTRAQRSLHMPYLHYGEHLAEGLEKFSTVPSWFFRPFVNGYLAAIVNASVAAPPRPEGWPVVLFSHGMAGSLELYAIVGQELASEGNIVILPNHMDGSGSVMRREPDGPIEYYVHLTDEMMANVNGEGFRFRHRQLQQRVSELRRVLDAVTNEQQSCSETNQSSVFAFMDTNSAHVAGHSFGGATALSAAHADKRFNTAVLLDTWMEPLAEDIKTGLGTQTPVLHIISEQFYQWKSHLEDMKQLARGCMHAASRLLLMRRLRHNNFSDIPAFSPLLQWVFMACGSVDPYATLRMIGRLSATFMRSATNASMENGSSSLERVLAQTSGIDVVDVHEKTREA